jgi:hypothetical protein
MKRFTPWLLIICFVFAICLLSGHGSDPPHASADEDQQYFTAVNGQVYRYLNQVVDLLKKPPGSLDFKPDDPSASNFLSHDSQETFGYEQYAGLTLQDRLTPTGFDSVHKDFTQVLLGLNEVNKHFPAFESTCTIRGWWPDRVAGTPNRWPDIVCLLMPFEPTPPEFRREQRDLDNAIWWYAKAEVDARAADRAIVIGSDYIR